MSGVDVVEVCVHDRSQAIDLIVGRGKSFCALHAFLLIRRKNWIYWYSSCFIKG